MRKTKNNLLAALAIIISLSASYSQANQGLFYSLSLSDEGKIDFITDQIFFRSVSAPKILMAESHDDLYSWHTEAIDFVTDGRVTGSRSNVKTLSLLDKSYKLIISSKPDETYIDSEAISRYHSTGPDVSFFIHKNTSSSIEDQLSTPAKSAYRLSNYFGLTAMAESIKRNSRPFGHCEDIVGSAYTCDLEKNGPFSIMGKSLSHYSDTCKNCTSSDRFILSMVSSHHLLRSRDKASRAIGEAVFHKNKKEFKLLDINYKQLKEIYLRSLSS